MVRSSTSGIASIFGRNINNKRILFRYLGETEITEKRAEYTRKEDGENYKLIIKQVATELKGKYTCKVVNDIGSAESSADLIVNCKSLTLFWVRLHKQEVQIIQNWYLILL